MYACVATTAKDANGDMTVLIAAIVGGVGLLLIIIIIVVVVLVCRKRKFWLKLIIVASI